MTILVMVLCAPFVIAFFLVLATPFIKRMYRA